MPTQEQLDNRAAWLKALRSGEYKQTTGVLQREKSYCCLGVAATIADIPKRASTEAEYVNYTFPSGTYQSGPELVWFCERFGIKMTNSTTDLLSVIYNANDRARLDFDQIASFMEHLFQIIDANDGVWKRITIDPVRYVRDWLATQS